MSPAPAGLGNGRTLFLLSHPATTGLLRKMVPHALAVPGPRVADLNQMRTSVTIGLGLGIGTGATLGLAAGGFLYASRWPASQMFGRTLIAPRRRGELALTFDDGPN